MPLPPDYVVIGAGAIGGTIGARLARGGRSVLLCDADREHVTAFFYRHPNRFRIVNVASADPTSSAYSLVVDTLDDLRRLECIPVDEERRLVGKAIAI